MITSLRCRLVKALAAIHRYITAHHDTDWGVWCIGYVGCLVLGGGMMSGEWGWSPCWWWLIAAPLLGALLAGVALLVFALIFETFHWLWTALGAALSRAAARCDQSPRP